MSAEAYVLTFGAPDEPNDVHVAEEVELPGGRRYRTWRSRDVGLHQHAIDTIETLIDADPENLEPIVVSET